MSSASQNPPRPKPYRLLGMPFGAWIAVGIGLGITVPVGVLLGAAWLRSRDEDAFSALDPLTAGMAAFAVIALAGVVCMLASRTRGLGTGLLISVATTPIVLFGVCVAILKGG